MASNTVEGKGIGLGAVLFLIFLVLKLCGVIDWSWWCVAAPLWIPLGLICVMWGIIGILYVGERVFLPGETDDET